MEPSACPEPTWLQQVLLKAGVVERRNDLLVQPLPRNPARSPHDPRRTFVVWAGCEPLFHVTVGRKLADLRRRQAGFAKAYPELACHPLFFLRHERWDIAGRDYFVGSSLEHGLRTGQISAAQASDILNQVFATLAQGERDSSPQAALQELESFGAEIAALPAWTDVDRVFLREIVLPWMRENLGPGPFRRRWTNGDFIARNLLVDSAGQRRVIDYEFAAPTHFFADDVSRLDRHSHLPEAVIAGVPQLRKVPDEFHTVYSLLNHARLSARVLAPELAQGELAHGAGHIARILSSFRGRRSLFLGGAMISGGGETSRTAPVHVKVYWSETGSYTEEQSVTEILAPARIAQLVLDLPRFSRVRHLRIDPCDRAGLVEIQAVVVRRTDTDEVLLVADDDSSLASLMLGGTAMRLPLGSSFTVLCSGDDPWIEIPPLPRVVDESVRVEVRLRYVPAAEALMAAAAAIDALQRTQPPARGNDGSATASLPKTNTHRDRRSRQTRRKAKHGSPK